MEIKDLDRTKIPLYFYSDGRVSELTPTRVQRGIWSLFSMQSVILLCLRAQCRHDSLSAAVQQALVFLVLWQGKTAIENLPLYYIDFDVNISAIRPFRQFSRTRKDHNAD